LSQRSNGRDESDGLIILHITNYKKWRKNISQVMVQAGQRTYLVSRKDSQLLDDSYDDLQNAENVYDNDEYEEEEQVKVRLRKPNKNLESVRHKASTETGRKHPQSRKRSRTKSKRPTTKIRNKTENDDFWIIFW
jgi:hypothetical protein